MPRHRTAALLGLLSAFALVGCGRGKAPPPAQPTPTVTVARPVAYPVRDYFEYNGYLDTTETVEVRARVRGFLNRVRFTEGTEVRGEIRWLNGEVLVPGDLLYEIDPREYLTAERKAVAEVEKAKADVENWAAQIKLAEADLKRAEMASKTGVASETELDKAKASVRVNTAQKEAAVAAVGSAEAALRTARIQLGYTDIRAKIDGRISRTHVTEGNLVGQNDATMLTTIVRVDELFVYFDVPESDLVAYQQSNARSPGPDPTSRTIDVEVGVATEKGYPHLGKIDFRENRVETATGTVRLRGRIPNPPGPTGVRLLYPGLYARVRVPNGPPREQLVIPEDAVMTGQSGRFVYVLGADGNVERPRPVTVGPVVWRAPPEVPGEAVPGWDLVNPNPAPMTPGREPIKSVVAITSGLKPGDRVIVRGVQKIRPGSPATPEEWAFQPPPPAK